MGDIENNYQEIKSLESQIIYVIRDLSTNYLESELESEKQI